MKINHIGNVGIGAGSPAYPLDVDTTGSAISGSMRYFNANNGVVATSGGLGGVQIRADGGIFATDFVAASDSRIKKDILEIPDGEALTNFRLLKPCKYKYIDENKKGNIGDVYGFIAQEVKAVLPYAVKTVETEVIPNVYQGGTYTDGIITLPEPHGLTENGDRIKLLVTTEAKDIYCPFTIIDTLKINIDTSQLSDGDIPSNDPLYDVDGNQLDYNIFVYGTEVDDFHILNKAAIWSTGVAALQEVDRIQQDLVTQLNAEKTKTVTLETLVEAEKTKTTTLETQIADLLARMTALENP